MNDSRESLDDWDNMGQRQTDSGTVVFERVRIAADELLNDPGPLSSPYACLRPLLAQVILSHIYLGRCARSTTAALRLDRFWRNVRVHTLHDPLDYKVRELGDWALNGRMPKPSFYS